MRRVQNDVGWIRRELRDIRKQIRELSAAKRLQAATIGKGGLRIVGGGSLRAFYASGRTAFSFGRDVAASDYAGTPDFQFRVNADRDVDSALLEVFKVTDETAGIPLGEHVVRMLGPDIIAANGARVIQLSTGAIDAPQYDNILTMDPERGTQLFAVVGSLTLSGENGVRVYHLTTGAAANCFIDPSDGRLWRSTSSRRYKQDIEDLDVDASAVLRMRPRVWRDRGEVAKRADTSTRYVGFIAEELHDLGLGAFVVYDDADEPEAIAYDRLSAALVVLAQDQEKRIAAQESELESLRLAVESLAARVGE